MNRLLAINGAIKWGQIHLIKELLDIWCYTSSYIDFDILYIQMAPFLFQVLYLTRHSPTAICKEQDWWREWLKNIKYRQITACVCCIDKSWREHSSKEVDISINILINGLIPQWIDINNFINIFWTMGFPTFQPMGYIVIAPAHPSVSPSVRLWISQRPLIVFF